MLDPKSKKGPDVHCPNKSPGAWPRRLLHCLIRRRDTQADCRSSGRERLATAVYMWGVTHCFPIATTAHGNANQSLSFKAIATRLMQAAATKNYFKGDKNFLFSTSAGTSLNTIICGYYFENSCGMALLHFFIHFARIVLDQARLGARLCRAPKPCRDARARNNYVLGNRCRSRDQRGRR